MSNDTRMIDIYPVSEPADRARMLLDHFRFMDMMLNGFKRYLVNEIIEIMKSEAHDQHADIRVQNSYMSDPTAETAIKHVEIEALLESGRRAERLVPDSAGAAVVQERIRTYRLLKKESKIMREHLENQEDRNVRILVTVLMGEKKYKEIAADENITERSVRTIVDNTKNQLIAYCVQYFD